MNPNTIRTIFAIFLIAHGLMTMSLSTVPVPKPDALRTPYFPTLRRPDVDKLWPAARLGLPERAVRTAGWALWLSATVLFVFAGVVLLFAPGLSALWQVPALIAALLSLVLLGFYWHPWLVIGVLLNAGIAVAYFAGWLTRWFSK